MSAKVIPMDKDAQARADYRLISGDNAAEQFGGAGTLYWPIRRKKVAKNLQGLDANMENLLWLTQRTPAPLAVIEAMARTMQRDIRCLAHRARMIEKAAKKKR